MVTLEQVKLLENKVARVLRHVETLSTENATLREKLDGYKNRIDELETIVLAFKEDQTRIEAGIVAALERLNSYEDSLDSSVLESSRPELNEKTVEHAGSLEPGYAKDDGSIASAAFSGDEPSNSALASEALAPDTKTAELDIF